MSLRQHCGSLLDVTGKLTPRPLQKLEEVQQKHEKRSSQRSESKTLKRHG